MLTFKYADSYLASFNKFRGHTTAGAIIPEMPWYAIQLRLNKKKLLSIQIHAPG